MIKDLLVFKKDSNLKWVYYAVVAVVIIAIVVVIAKVYKSWKIAQNAAGEELGNAIIATQSGVDAARIAVLKQAAVDAENAVSRVPLTGWKLWVDDDAVVAACNKVVTDKEAGLMSRFYKEDTGESLRQEIIEGGYMVESSRKKITYRSSFN